MHTLHVLLTQADLLCNKAPQCICSSSALVPYNNCWPQLSAAVCTQPLTSSVGHTSVKGCGVVPRERMLAACRMQ
jgi:hypothetical protein